MLMERLFIIGFALLLFAILWLIFGFVNYKQVLRQLAAYTKRVAYYEYLEQAGTGGITAKASSFLKRSELIHANPSLEQLRLEIIEDEKETLRKIKRHTLLLGPLYNL